MAKTYNSFLGENSPRGFVSFFDELYNPYGCSRVFIIKGGPGTGKSTLMKKAGRYFESKNYDVEYVCCASDPDSLDAVIVPEFDICFVDGTSPHIVEPAFPGAVENIINTGDFWKSDKLRKNADEIRKKSARGAFFR